ncbi:MAG: glycosyltransferase [Actinobacteria bacterium]|nr:glycosyltransferase [Actinomycetota bacterium]
MRLVIDLRFSPPPDAHAPDDHVVTLDQLAGLGRQPGQLVRLLAGRRWDEVRVLRDERALSGVQAGGEGLAALARARRFELARPDGASSSGRGAFLARASADFATAMPRELARSALLARRAARVGAEPFELPAPSGRPQRVTYLRTEPSLRWMGLHVGGAATHTAGVVNGLAAEGADVHVYAPERPAGTEAVPCTPVPARWLYQLVHWLTLFDYADDVVAAAAGRPADAVYQRYALGSHAGLTLARRLGVPLILEFNGSEIWTERHWGGGRVPLVRTLAALERRNLIDATLVVVVSEVLRDQLVEEGIPAERVLVNPNGVDVDALAPLRARPPAEWRVELGLPEAPTIGFIGTFGLWHGVKVLPALIDAVQRERPDARWQLVGNGPLHAEVAQELRERGLGDVVELTGALPHEQAVRRLAACDAFVSPHVPNPDGTRFFGSPTKLFEYMGLQRPIVASDLDQIGEVLEDGRTGLLVAPADPDAAAAGVVRLLGDAPLRERLAAAALAEAERTYAWSAHCRRILDAVEALADRPAAVAQPAAS